MRMTARAWHGLQDPRPCLELAQASDTVAPGPYDQDLQAQVSAARSADIAVAVLGSG
jgi:hypothetical protein